MINKDKALHFVVGVFLSLFSIWTVVAVALLKEIYDLNASDRVADWNDFIATVVGGLLGLHIWGFLWVF